MKYSKETNKIIQDIGLDEKNTGSSEAQIALLTDRIRLLTGHVKNHKKDIHSRYGLVKLVSQRKKQLKYLRKTNSDSYDELIEKLSIRGL
ncbi:MAG: 30S ribosomal protein S15 [Candidatus Neomarinimicrobiota bacterium]|jgi:small subunit ribosomal protein S15|nr:30S ribosomal protein S15 [Candidatus Neomarinimicrobiota bacterium]|tara:strand:+ start:29 stop:298 length:270 start_codon:yes stop_codon:yes gene_type:complete